MDELKALGNVIRKLDAYDPLLGVMVEEGRKSVVIVLRGASEEVVSEVIRHSSREGSLVLSGKGYLYSIRLGEKR